MYASFWIKFDQLSNGMTILDTGKSGVTFQYRDQQLMALLYPNGNNANPTNVSSQRVLPSTVDI